jgi:hypothetical protein
VTGQGGDHHIEGVGLAATVGGGVGEGPDELQLLDDRARPAVGDDQRQGVGMAGADVEEVDVEAVELGHELGQGVQPGFEVAPVVDRRPGAGQGLHGGQRHPLGVIVDRLTLGPPGRLDPPAQPLQVLLSNTHPKRTDRCGGRSVLGRDRHAGLLGGVDWRSTRRACVVAPSNPEDLGRHRHWLTGCRSAHAPPGRGDLSSPRPDESACRGMARGGGAGDGNRTRITSLEGASRHSDQPRSYADGAGQVGVRPTVVDREGPPDAGATGTRRARPARANRAPGWRRWSQAKPEGEARPRRPLASLARAAGPRQLD